MWLNRLDAAVEHVPSALAWALEPDRSASERHRAASVAVALSWFWYARGRAMEGRDWYGRCLAHTDGDLPPELRARVLEAAGTLAHQLGMADALHNRGRIAVRSTTSPPRRDTWT